MKHILFIALLSAACVAKGGGAAGPAAPPPPSEGPAPEGEPAAMAGGAIDCNSQPNHSIAENDRNLTFVGPCDKIIIDGNNINITAESAKGVMVNGNDNNVTVGTVDQIYTAGNNNNVTFRTGKPQVGNPGNGNNIGQAR